MTNPTYGAAGKVKKPGKAAIRKIFTKQWASTVAPASWRGKLQAVIFSPNRVSAKAHLRLLLKEQKPTLPSSFPSG
jgi:PIN domain nuclease of toxin-antitoxin system